MKMIFSRILIVLTFATGITTISFAQNNDSIPKPRYTLYPDTPKSTPTNIDTSHSSEIDAPVIRSVTTESPVVDSAVIESPVINPVEPSQNYNESGLPVTSEKPMQETKSNVADPIIIESSISSQAEPQSERPVSTERFVSPEGKKSNVSPDGTIKDWSNPPGFTGYAQNKDVKMEKHVMKTKKHKYRPHHKYQHKKKHIKNPKF